MSWSDLDRDDMTAAHSRLESDRFGLSMGRVVVGQRVRWDDEAAARLASLLERDEDVLVVRYPPSLAACPGILATAGRDVIAADSLAYWQASTAVVAEAGTGGDPPEPRPVDSVDRDVLAAAVTAAFQGYVNHYAANPLLDPERALEGYVEWALGMLTAGSEHGVLLSTDDRVDAWGMSVDGADGTHVEYVLAGVSPQARGRSLYTEVMAEVARRAMSRGIDRMVTSTQASNVGIQRVWARAGWLPMAAVTTVHLVRRGLLDVGIRDHG